MSIWKELYDIFDKERAGWKSNAANKGLLAFEIQSNRTFLGDAIQNEHSQISIVKNLDRSVFDQSMKNGFSINSISKKKVTTETIGGFDEFKKYIDKDTEYLVKNAYSKIGSLTKLVNSGDGKDYSLKVKSLFRFLTFLGTHIEGQHLPSRPNKDAANRAV